MSDNRDSGPGDGTVGCLPELIISVTNIPTKMLRSLTHKCDLPSYSNVCLLIDSFRPNSAVGHASGTTGWEVLFLFSRVLLQVRFKYHRLKHFALSDSSN